MESVDFATMQFPADSKSGQANGARGVCRYSWRLALHAQDCFESPSIYCRQQFPLLALQIFQSSHKPVGFIGESIGAVDSLERGVAPKYVKADAPLQFAQANRTKMHRSAIAFSQVI